MKENWNIFFYDGNQDEDYKFKFIFSFCKNFGDYLKVAGVDCKEYPDLCEQQGVNKFPTLKLYYGENRNIEIRIYEGLKEGFLVKQNLNLMKNFVVRLNEVNYLDKIKENFGKAILISFTSRKNSSLMYRSLANKYHKKIMFAEIFHTDPFVQKFQPAKIPSLYLVTDPLHYKGVYFEGKFTKKNIIKFFNDHAFSKKEEKYVMELNKERIEMGSCGKKDKSFCFVALVESPKQLAEIRKILKVL